MPFGKTLEKIQFNRWLDYRSTVPIERPARERDRSLPGKKRRLARKARQRGPTDEEKAGMLKEVWGSDRKI